MRVALASFLEFIAEHPGGPVLHRRGAGRRPKALARRDAGVRQFTHFIDAGRAETSVQLPGITSLAIVGGIHELLYSEIIHGATAQLPTRLPELVFWIVHPFLGPERAIAERDRARAMLAERAGIVVPAG